MTNLLPPIPTARAPRRAEAGRTLTGARVLVAQQDPTTKIVTWVPDYRAASDVFTADGREWVNVVTEADWYQWVNSTDPGKPPRCPRAVVAPAVSVLVE